MADVEDIERENAKLKRENERLQRRLASVSQEYAAQLLVSRGVEETAAREIYARKHADAISFTTTDEVNLGEVAEKMEAALGDVKPMYLVPQDGTAPRRETTGYDPVADGRARAKAQRRQQGLDNDLAFK